MNPLDEYCIVVVLYKMDVAECPSIQSLLTCRAFLQRSTLVVCDNSPQGVPEEKLAWLKAQFCSVSYRHTPANMPLSLIYNAAYNENSGFAYLVLLDQDSRFGADYFQQLNHATKTYGSTDLFVPAIYHETRLMSPGYFYAFKGRYRSGVQPGLNSTKHMCIVTSGICVSYRYLHSHFSGFDERLRFYSIDTFFSLQFRKHQRYFFVLDCAFHHSFSQHEEEEYETKLRRFADYRSSLLILLKNHPAHIQLLGRLYLFYGKMQLAAKHALRKKTNVYTNLEKQS